jgi:hypothetical protein
LRSGHLVGKQGGLTIDAGGANVRGAFRIAHGRSWA